MVAKHEHTVPCQGGECKDVNSINKRIYLLGLIILASLTWFITGSVSAKNDLHIHRESSASKQAEQDKRLDFHKEMIDNLVRTNERIFKELTELNKSVSGMSHSGDGRDVYTRGAANEKDRGR